MSKTAGLLFFLGSSVVIFGILIAEIFYPNYSVSLNMISNLGSSPPPSDIVKQPSASIFDWSMIIGGLLILSGAFFQHKARGHRFLKLTTALMGLGAFGVGILPASHFTPHIISALITFAAAGLSAVISATVIKGPFRYIAFGLGIFSLIFLSLGIFMPQQIVPILGRGGTERLVAYPTLIWLAGYGAYLMARK